MPASRTRPSVSRRSSCPRVVDDLAVELGRRVEIVVVVVEARVRELLGLPVLQHAERRAGLQSQRLHAAHHVEHRVEVAILRTAPRGAHAEARRAGFLRAARRVEHRVEPEHGLVADAGVVARRLRAVAAVLGTAAGLDRQQRRQAAPRSASWCARWTCCAPEQEVGERELEQREHCLGGPARRVPRALAGALAGGTGGSRFVEHRSRYRSNVGSPRTSRHHYNPGRCRGAAVRLSNSANAALYAWRAAASDGARAAVTFALPQRCALCACAAGDACLCGACLDAIATRTPACPRCALPSPRRRSLRTLPRPSAGLGRSGRRRVLRVPARPPRAAAQVRRRPAAGLGARGAARGRRAGRRHDVTRRRDRADAARRGAPAREGYNQAREIARAVARATLACRCARGLERSRHAVPQATLPWRERVRNVRGAFATSGALAGARVALVDDVMTSGATAAAAAAALRRGGASRVEVWVVARTLPARG